METYRISQGRCDYLSNPLGVDNPTPRFTWIYNGDNPRQLTAESRLELGQGNQLLWTADWQPSPQTALSYGGPALDSSQRYWWKAYTRLIGQPDSEASSETYWFETGLLHPTDWHGAWIQADPSEEAPIIFRTVHLHRKPHHARAYVSGLGLFLLFVNGRKVGNEVLQPIWTSYSRQKATNMLYPYDYQGVHRVPYCTFDLTPFLHQGDNLIEIHLGNGWFHQTQRRVEGDLWYGETPVLLFEGRVDSTLICSDRQWQWKSSQVTRNNLFYGETQDLARNDLTAHPVTIAPPPQGDLSAQSCPGDAALKDYAVTRAYPTPQRHLILDFSQNLSGRVRLLASGQPGDRLELRFAEEITQHEDGWTMNYGTAGAYQDSHGDLTQIQTDAFILSGTPLELLEPQFCWHGFRYAEVTLLRQGQDIPLILNRDTLKGSNFTATATAQFIAANLPENGSFACDHDTLNWFHHAAVMSLRSNQHGGVPMDCPHRERLGYTGDGQVAAQAVLWNMDAISFEHTWMKDILDAQSRKTGHVPHTAPFYNGGGGPGGWGGAIVFLPWTLYRHTGDPTFLSEAWPHMKAWITYLDQHSEDGIVTREEDGGWCLGEWCTPEKITIEPALVNSAFTIRMLQIMTDIAKLLHEDPQDLQENANRRKTAFRRHFNLDLTQDTQGSLLFALWAETLTEKEKPKAMRGLLNSLAHRDWHFPTGIFGTPLLLELLSQNGYTEEAFKLMTVQGYPSFETMRSKGATTLYEHWFGAGSHNHAMFAAADTWLYQWVAGIKQDGDSVGWADIRFQPGILKGIRHAQASLDTPMGHCALNWTWQASTLHINLESPALSRSTLVLPWGETLPLPGGRFSLNATRPSPQD